MSLDRSLQQLLRRIFLLSLGLVLSAQSSASAKIHSVIDETRVFDRATADSLAEEIADFHRATGCHLIVKAVTYLDSGTTLRSEALHSRREIFPTGPVAIFLLDRATNSLTLSLSSEHWQRYPILQQLEAVRSASNAGAEAESLGGRLLLCAQHWMSEVRVLEEERKRQFNPHSVHSKILFGSYVALLVVGALIIGIVVQFRRKAEMISGEQVTLPDVAVAPRLGAPFGGGVLAEWPSLDQSTVGRT